MYYGPVAINMQPFQMQVQINAMQFISYAKEYSLITIYKPNHPDQFLRILPLVKIMPLVLPMLPSFTTVSFWPVNPKLSNGLLSIWAYFISPLDVIGAAKIEFAKIEKAKIFISRLNFFISNFWLKIIIILFRMDHTPISSILYMIFLWYATKWKPEVDMMKCMKEDL